MGKSTSLTATHQTAVDADILARARDEVRVIVSAYTWRENGGVARGQMTN